MAEDGSSSVRACRLLLIATVESDACQNSGQAPKGSALGPEGLTPCIPHDQGVLAFEPAQGLLSSVAKGRQHQFRVGLVGIGDLPRETSQQVFAVEEPAQKKDERIVPASPTHQAVPRSQDRTTDLPLAEGDRGNQIPCE